MRNALYNTLIVAGLLAVALAGCDNSQHNQRVEVTLEAGERILQRLDVSSTCHGDYGYVFGLSTMAVLVYVDEDFNRVYGFAFQSPDREIMYRVLPPASNGDPSVSVSHTLTLKPGDNLLIGEAPFAVKLSMNCEELLARFISEYEAEVRPNL